MDTGLFLRDGGVESSAEVLAPLRRVCIAFIIVNTIFLVLRFITVLFLRPKKLSLSWDDWFLIPAYILTIAMAADGFVIHDHASNPIFNADTYMVHPSALTLLKADFVMTQLVTPAFAFTRYSILALFIRIFYRPYVRRVSYILIGFVTLQLLVFNITSALSCRPTDWYWNRIFAGMTGAGGHCVNLDKFYIAFQAPEMFVDVAIIFLPLPEIWRLRSTRARKIGLTTLFLTGFIALAANCFRQAIFVKYPVTTFTPRMENHTTAWLVAEPSICFIAACLPAMSPLVSRLAPAALKEQAKRLSLPVMEQRSHIHKRSMSSGFDRLVETERSLTPRPATPASVAGTPKYYGYEAKAARSATSMEFDTSELPSVPLNDWRQVKYGNGVLVRTEITITQEDLIEDVLGI